VFKRGEAPSFNPSPSPLKERGIEGERLNINERRKRQ